MAGFKQPVYEILSLQSFSVYDRNYELFETSTIALLLMMQPMITTINY
jgi:hypothetical protein